IRRRRRSRTSPGSPPPQTEASTPRPRSPRRRFGRGADPYDPPLMPTLRPDIGVEIVGTGRYLPERRITNADLVQVMDTSDEWIVQRTGIRERRKADPDAGETVA